MIRTENSTDRIVDVKRIVDYYDEDDYGKLRHYRVLTVIITVDNEPYIPNETDYTIQKNGEEIPLGSVTTQETPKPNNNTQQGDIT